MTDAIELAERVHRAGEAVDGLEPQARAAAIELREAVEAIHAEGLRDIVRTLLADPRGTELLREAAHLPAARTVLMLHGIVRRDVAAQAEDVLARLRPALREIGGDVEVDHVEGGTLYVRLTGECEGNSATARTYQEQVCEVLAEQVEGLESVEVAPSPPPPVTVPLESMLRRVGRSNREDRSVAAEAAAPPSDDDPLGAPNAIADSISAPGREAARP